MPDVLTSSDASVTCAAPLVELMVTPPAPPVPTPMPCKAGSSEVDKGKCSKKVKTGGAKLCLDQKGVFKKETPPHVAGKPPSQKSPVSMTDEGACSPIKVPLTAVKVEGKNVLHVGTPMGMDEGPGSPGTAGTAGSGCSKISLGTPAPGAGGGGPSGGPFKRTSDPVADVGLLINEYSPTLRKQVEDLENTNWIFVYNPLRKPGKGGGTYCKGGRVPRIYVDPKNARTKEALLGTLAHEAGHAKYSKREFKPGASTSLWEFKSRNVAESLKDEGHAVLNEISIHKEIRAKSGDRINTSISGHWLPAPQGSKVPAGGTMADHFVRVSENPLPEDAKARIIGRHYGDMHPSTDPTTTYREMWESYYDSLGRSLGLK